MAGQRRGQDSNSANDTIRQAGAWGTRAALIAAAALLLGGAAMGGCADDAASGGAGSQDTGGFRDAIDGGADTGAPDTQTTSDTSGVCEPGPDDDSDNLTNEQEGAAQATDTDGDGRPDYLDDDSDGDSIRDLDEASDADPCTPPADSNGDGIPDFRSEDADGDGIPDRVEAGDENPSTPPIDSDSDGTPDFQDEDADGDGIPDRVEVGDADPTTAPIDFDRDNIPDYLDPDSDGDTVPDLYEGSADSDRDGIPDRHDLDSDNDGIPDAEEFGPGPAPRDSDGDTIPDFRDIDSDNDGITDLDERTLHNTDPYSRDTDADGAPDLVEIVASTDPRDAASNPQSRGDFFFVVPYQEPSYPDKDTLQFRTSVQVADLYFGFDASLSMQEEYDAMRNPTTGLPAVVSQLTCARTSVACEKHFDCTSALGSGYTCGPDDLCVADPLVSGCVPNLWTGVGKYGNLDTFRNLLSPQANPTTTANSIPAAGEPARVGGVLSGPWAEAPFHAVTCVADGGQCNNTDKNCDVRPDRVGCPGFRQDAVRIYVHVSDADDQCVNPPYAGIASTTDFANIIFNTGRCAQFNAQTAGAALAAQQIKFIGLYGNPNCDFALTDCDDYPEAQYNAWVSANAPSRPLKPATTPATVSQDMGRASGSLNSSGQPFVYEALNSAVVTRTTQAVRDILRESTLSVQIEALDVVEGPADTIDASQFVSHFQVELNAAGCTNVQPTADTDGDNLPDAFPQLQPGTPVCWDVFPIAVNDLIPSTSAPQIFRARLTVYGDGSPLDRRDVFFLIPAKLPDVIN
jgi:hypothetical protein